MINKQKQELQQKDSIISVKTDSLNILNIRWNDAKVSQSTYQGIAIGNQAELANQINELLSKVELQKNEINRLNNENTKLKQENKQLKANAKQ